MTSTQNKANTNREMKAKEPLSYIARARELTDKINLRQEGRHQMALASGSTDEKKGQKANGRQRCARLK